MGDLAEGENGERDDYGGNSTSMWLMLQIQSFMRSMPPPREFRRKLTVLEELCTNQGHLNHALSLAYSILLRAESLQRPEYLTKWERDLGLEFTDAQVKYIMTLSHKSSINSNLQEMNFKLLTRWYRTPKLLHRIFPAVSENCWRCSREVGDLFHIFWSCPVIQKFWQGVDRVISLILEEDLSLGPGICLLHLANIPAKSYRKSLLVRLLNTAKSCISLCWKSPDPPNLARWIVKINDLWRLEDLGANTLDKRQELLGIWHPWLNFQRHDLYSNLVGQLTVSGDG